MYLPGGVPHVHLTPQHTPVSGLGVSSGAMAGPRLGLLSRPWTSPSLHTPFAASPVVAFRHRCVPSSESGFSWE